MLCNCLVQGLKLFELWNSGAYFAEGINFFPLSYICEREAKQRESAVGSHECWWQVIPGDARDAMRPNTLNRSPISESKERPGGFRYPNYTSLPCQSPHPSSFLWEHAYSRMPLSLESRLIKLCNCSHPQNKRSWGKYFGVKLVFFSSLIFQSHTFLCVFSLPRWKIKSVKP